MSDKKTAAGGQARTVRWGLGIGIFLVPLIFSWFTLRDGHSTKAKVVAFIWLAAWLGWTVGGGKDAKQRAVASAEIGEVSASDSGTGSLALTVGATASTDYFDVTLNSCAARSSVQTGSDFAEPENRPGTRFLIVDATFENTDSESRMIEEGDAFLEAKGRKVKFDITETIMLEGWGGLEAVSPMTSYKTKIVYRVPEATGRFSWQPGRNSDDLTFDCGDL